MSFEETSSYCLYTGTEFISNRWSSGGTCFHQDDRRGTAISATSQACWGRQRSRGGCTAVVSSSPLLHRHVGKVRWSSGDERWESASSEEGEIDAALILDKIGKKWRQIEEKKNISINQKIHQILCVRVDIWYAL